MDIPAATETIEKLLRTNIGPVDLKKIASADYGENLKENFEALKKIAENDFTTPNHWIPVEVLSLMRWHTPAGKRSNGIDYPAPVSGYWQCLFSCYVLLKSNAIKSVEFELLDHDGTYATFLETSVTLGEETAVAALQFFKWLNVKVLKQDQPFMLPLGIHLLNQSLGIATQQIAQVVDGLLTEDPEARNFVNFTLEKEIWKKFTR